MNMHHIDCEVCDEARELEQLKRDVAFLRAFIDQREAHAGDISDPQFTGRFWIATKEALYALEEHVKEEE